MPKTLKKNILIFTLSFLITAAVMAGVYVIRMPQYEKEKVDAELGSPEAQYTIARRLAGGIGVAEDDKAAVVWFRKAAEQNHVKACMTMARLYFTGDGVEHDDKQGAAWLRRAAENGSSFADAMMGILYIGGIGVTQDADMAVQWLSASAEPEADLIKRDLQRNLDKIYALPPDDREKALDTFFARRKLYTGEEFAMLMNKMQQTLDRGE